MPMLDVSDVILDPLFCESVNVTRNAVTVNSVGRDVVTPTAFTIIAVVTIYAKKIIRSPEEEQSRNKILVHTKTKLIDAAPGYNPDTVSWDGNNYVVIDASKWSKFGAGFYAVECEMIDLLSSPPA